MKKTIFTLIATLFLLTGCGAQEITESINISQSISVSSFAEKTIDDEYILIDIRTIEEIADGQLEGALNIDFYKSDFNDRLKSLDKDAKYLVYCRSGNRSGQTLEIMEGMGFNEVYDLEGGINAWIEADEEVSRCEVC